MDKLGKIRAQSFGWHTSPWGKNLSTVLGDFKFTNAAGVVGLDILSRFKSVTFDFTNSVMVLEDR
jgi:hypothetical protein